MFLPSLSHLALTGADNNGAEDDETEEDESVYPPPEHEEKSQRAMMDRMQQEEDEEWGRRYDLGTQGRNREDRVNRRAQEKEDAEEEARERAARPPPPTAREARERERRLRDLQREAAEKAKRERAEQEERAREQRARLESNPSRYSAQRQFNDALNKMLEEDDEDDLDRPIVLNRRAWQAGPDAPVQPPAAAPAAAPAPAEPEVVVLEDSESEELLDEGQLPPPPKQDAPSTEWRKVNRRQPPAPDQPRRRTIPSSVTGRASGTDLKAQRQRDARTDVKVRRVTNLVSEGETRVQGRIDAARNLEIQPSAVGAAFAQLLVGFMYVLSDARSRDYFVYKVANNSFLLTMWRNVALKLRVLAGKLMASGYFFPGHLLGRLNLLLENAVLAESSKKRCDTPGRRSGMEDELADLADFIEDNVTTEIPDEFEEEAERDNDDDDNDADDDAGADGDAAQ